jgi:hypothetical protein
MCVVFCQVLLAVWLIFSPSSSFSSQAVAAWLQDGLLVDPVCLEERRVHIYNLLGWRYSRPLVPADVAAIDNGTVPMVRGHLGQRYRPHHLACTSSATGSFTSSPPAPRWPMLATPTNICRLLLMPLHLLIRKLRRLGTSTHLFCIR